MSTHTTTTALLLSATLLSACAPLRTAEPTLTHQRHAIAQLSTTQQADAALLRSQVQAHLAIQRTLLLGDTHRAFLARGYLPAEGGANTTALRADIADPSITNPLIDDIRAGRLSAVDAALLLTDYALAAQMTGRAPRDAILARLAEIKRFDESAEALLTALDRRASDAKSLAQEALASSDALLTASRSEFTLDAPASAAAEVLWERLVLARIPDPADRAAAAELLNDLLAERSATP